MIYLITGIMASGKSTVADVLAGHFKKSVHLRGDIFRRMILNGREEMTESPTSEAHSQLDLRYRLTAEAAKMYHQAGFTVVMQDNYYGEKLPYVLSLLAPEPVQAIVLCPNANTVQLREQQRGKIGYSGFSVESLHRSFMENTPRIGLWIDNSEQTPAETVAQILRATYGQNKESYNKIADQWNESRNALPLNPCVMDFVARIKPAGNVLDIGCGTGYPITKYLSEQGFMVTGIDISQNMLKRAVDQKLANTKLYLCDFFHFEPTERYDGIIAFDTFFHFPQEKQAEIYQRVSGWLNKGAYFLFTHGKSESEITDSMFGEPFYYSALHTQTVHKLLLDSGFSIEVSIEDHVESHSTRDLLILARKIR